MKKRNLFFLLMAFSFMLMSCNQSSERFFGVYLGEKFNKALAHFEKNGVKVEVSHDRQTDAMFIDVLDKQTFYNVDFSTVVLQFSHDKLEEINLKRYDNKSQTRDKREPLPADPSFDNIIKELEKKYGKPLKPRNYYNYYTRMAEFTGNGMVILVKERVETKEQQYGNYRYRFTELSVTIQRD